MAALPTVRKCTVQLQRGAGFLVPLRVLFLFLVLDQLMPTRATVATDLCYEVHWDLSAAQPKRAVVRPVTGFPTNHILVREGRCGRKYNAGDPIPRTGR